VSVLWRVAGSVAHELDIENQMHEISSLELADVVEQADAVITTPSTAMLEAMRLGRPSQRWITTTSAVRADGVDDFCARTHPPGRG